MNQPADAGPLASALARPAPPARARGPLLPRLHLIEIHEQPWCPDVLRRFGTDYLRTAVETLRPFAPLAAKIAEILRESGERRIVDLCSGGAGPMVSLARELAQRGLSVQVTLTDLYPDLDAFARARQASSGAVGFRTEPTDARRVPEDLAGMRTIFDALHHFRPDDARAILADAARRRVPIVVAEVARRALGPVLGMALLVPIVVMFAAPFVKPRTFARLAMTYLIPITPLLAAFDGVVSCLRAYSTAELQQMTAGLGGDGYSWEIGEVPSPGGTVTYVIGRPRPA